LFFPYFLLFLRSSFYELFSFPWILTVRTSFFLLFPNLQIFKSSNPRIFKFSNPRSEIPSYYIFFHVNSFSKTSCFLCFPTCFCCFFPQKRVQRYGLYFYPPNFFTSFFSFSFKIKFI
jgi:hypothetical protein